jgi:Response receiver domain
MNEPEITMQTAANPTTDIRRQISGNLFRSILWIDEEIFPFLTKADEKIINYELFKSLFWPVTHELQEKGYLVHLHPFEQSTNEDGINDTYSTESPSLNSAIALCKKADVVLLDWHLGSGHSPENSIKILDELLKEEKSATKIVLILSNNDSCINDIGSKLPKLQVNASTGTWSYNGLHLKLLKKMHNGSRITADEIINAIFESLSGQYPDYLHWAALEIAEKIRSHIPEWLESLPKETDLAVLQELLNEKSEIRSYLPENLFENLVCIASANKLNSLEAKNTKREHWENRPSFIKDTGDTITEKYVNVLVSAENLREDYKDIEKKKGTTNGFDAWIKAHHTNTEFCEILPMKGISPLPGAVYNRVNLDAIDESIYICVSQECDCLRDNTLLFVRAVKCERIKDSSTSVRFNGHTYRIDSKTDNLIKMPINVDRTIEQYNKIGQLRPQIAKRIISRFWNGTTRSAVNHPTFTRALRKGEV